MLRVSYTTALIALVGTTAFAADAPPIAVIDSATPSEELPVKPGVYVGQKITFEEQHQGDVFFKAGVWEADVSKTYLKNYPYSEYVLMISGRVVITNEDGTSNEFGPGDTFVIPKGFSGWWDIKERMKKQLVQVGVEQK